MGKSTNGQQSNKSTIAKEKLSDSDFDKLVIDTSHQVTQKSSTNLQSSNSKEVQQRGLVDDDDCGKSTDPNRLNQPKRPMNAFMVWGQAIRRELHDRFSNVQNALLSKALGRVWRSLDPVEKEPFVKRANIIKANHKRDFPNYRYRPRRIQERRAKCNMLIGIHLNHPINQNPRQSNFVMDHTVTNQNIIHATRDARLDNQHATHKQRSVNLDRNFCGLEELEETTKQAEGVRAYEYPPYPVAQRTENNRNHPVLDCRNYLAGIGCHSEGFNELQQQTAVASKQSTEASYPLYRQFVYNVQQQQHQQQQQYQQLPYEVSQQVGHFEVRESPAVNNTTNYYTTMNTTANQPTHTHHQVFTHPDIRESHFKCSSYAN